MCIFFWDIEKKVSKLYYNDNDCLYGEINHTVQMCERLVSSIRRVGIICNRPRKNESFRVLSRIAWNRGNDDHHHNDNDGNNRHSCYYYRYYYFLVVYFFFTTIHVKYLYNNKKLNRVTKALSADVSYKNFVLGNYIVGVVFR